MAELCEICGNPNRKQKGPKIPTYCSRQCNGVATIRRRERETGATKEWLYQKYVVEQLDCPAIAKLVNRDPKGVWNWIVDYGIPTRKRGDNEAVRFKKGHKLRVGMKHSQATCDRLREVRLLDGRVPYLKDGKHHLKGKRGAETPTWKGGCTPERQGFYSSAEWKAVVSTIWRRDRWSCQRCDLFIREARKQGIRYAIHHIVSFRVRRLRAEPTNLLLLCRPCHLWVHSRENTNKDFIHDSDDPIPG